MKILFTTHSLGIGGIEVLALRLSEAFGKAGHDVLLYDFNPDQRNEEMVRKYDRSFFQIVAIQPSRLVSWLTWKANAILFKTGLNRHFRPGIIERHFAGVLAVERPDIICSLTFHQDYIACTHAAPLNIPVVISMHGTYEHAAPEFPAEAKFIYSQVKAIIYAADKNMSWYEQQAYLDPAKPALKIYTGTDLSVKVQPAGTRQSLGMKEQDFVFILVARGIKEKGWLEAIEAFKKLHALHPGTALLLVGAGEYLNGLKETYRQEHGVLFYGSHPDSIGLTALANVGLLPSYYPIETMPNVIVDYLRCSLPVIASDIGEIPAMLTLEDGTVAGSILPRHNQAGVDVAALYEAMLQMVAGKDYYAHQVALAGLAVRKFDIRDCLVRYTEVFEQAIHAAT